MMEPALSKVRLNVSLWENTGLETPNTFENVILAFASHVAIGKM